MNEKILLVDDEESNLRLLSQWLIPLGYDIKMAANGEEAVREARECRPDLIILDIMMPVMDGYEACRILKADPESRNIPIIMVTALLERESKLKGLSISANDFISKPIDQVELIIRVKNLLKIKAYEDLIRNHNELLEQQVRQRTADLESAYDKLKSSQDQLLQQEKMATIGVLMAGIAHEINNPVGYITSNLVSLKKYGERLIGFISEQDEVIRAGAAAPRIVEQLAARRSKLKIDHILMDFPELLDESVEGADRIKKIVQDLKCFSRKDMDQMASADINQCLKSALGIVHNELKYKAVVVCDYGELSPTFCNAQQLGQVFINLLINAVHAIDTQGKITVSTRQENGLILITISDTGCGIPEDIRQSIFDPFFTTKEVGKGTGLGLAICQDIINKHGGKLELASEIGMGTTFSVSIPVVTKAS
jgi:signal transduction histidine kinase